LLAFLAVAGLRPSDKQRALYYNSDGLERPVEDNDL